jgi:hypothetical protein
MAHNLGAVNDINISGFNSESSVVWSFLSSTGQPDGTSILQIGIFKFFNLSNISMNGARTSPI